PGQPITAQQAMALDYTGQVISESMRLCPPAWIISRKAIDDDTIDGHLVPAGSYVFTCPYILHRHPAHWDNPEGFDPEGFAPDAPSRHSHAMLPFGGGRRKCIGSHFALLESRIVLASLLRRLDLSLLPGARIQPHASVTLRPTGDTRMSATPLS
ncbi:MAG: cytochrome P450, partial [Myxococcota bacterium]